MIEHRESVAVLERARSTLLQWRVGWNGKPPARSARAQPILLLNSGP